MCDNSMGVINQSFQNIGDWLKENYKLDLDEFFIVLKYFKKFNYALVFMMWDNSTGAENTKQQIEHYSTVLVSNTFTVAIIFDVWFLHFWLCYGKAVYTVFISIGRCFR